MPEERRIRIRIGLDCAYERNRFPCLKRQWLITGEREKSKTKKKENELEIIRKYLSRKTRRMHLSTNVVYQGRWFQMVTDMTPCIYIFTHTHIDARKDTCIDAYTHAYVKKEWKERTFSKKKRWITIGLELPCDQHVWPLRRTHNQTT